MQYLCVVCYASWLKQSNHCPQCRALGAYNDAEQTRRLMIHVKAGNADAYYHLYTWLLVGQPDLPQDIRRAVVCLKIAAAKGHTKASYVLALTFLHGRDGVPGNPKRSSGTAGPSCIIKRSSISPVSFVGPLARRAAFPFCAATSR